MGKPFAQVTQTVLDIWDRRVTLETMVSHEAYGMLLELSRGNDPTSRGLRGILKTRYDLAPDSLEARIATAQKQFWEQHAEWMPPQIAEPSLTDPDHSKSPPEDTGIP